MHFRIAASILIALAMFTIPACSESDHDSDRDRYDDDRYDRISRDPDRYDDEYDRDRDDRSRDRRDDAYGVPRGAVVVEEGDGSTLKHKPAHPGRAYLYDVDDDRVVYDVRLRRDEALVIDPDADSIKVDGVRDAKVNLRAKHRYRLYYLRDDADDYDRRKGERF